MLHRRLATLVALAPLVALPASAFAPASPGTLSELVRSVPLPVPAIDADQQARLQATNPGIEGLIREANGPWTVEFDVTSGRLRRAFGAGIPLLPAAQDLKAPRGSDAPLAVVEQEARAFLARHAELFETNLAEFTLDVDGSGNLDSGRLRVARFVRAVDGVRIENAAIVVVFKFGKLFYINATGLDPVLQTTNPALSVDESWAIVGQAVASVKASLADASQLGRPELLLLPTQSAPGGPITHRLVRRHTFRLGEGVETWRAGVDAVTGELVELVDRNSYACTLDPALVQGRVRGGIRPSMANDAEEVRDFIYPRVVDNGVGKNGDSNGYFPYTGPSVTSTMNGTFFNVNCNGCTTQPSVTSTTDGILDFGTGGVDQNSNGKSTPADRTALYHENVARSIAAKWDTAPLNPWMQTNVLINTNINMTCNAFWNGSSLNFFRSGGPCTNTGEIRDVMQHEWGHGLDQNDGLAPADGGTGEAYGDHIALFVDHDSCIGQSFFAQSSGPYCTMIPTCGGTRICTGVRNIDEKRTTSGLMSMTSAPSNCGTSTGCRGPLGLECHCEGEIWGQADFHLAFNLLTGMGYDTGTPLPGANPAFSEVAAWFVLEHLFFNANGIFNSYAPSNRQTTGIGAYDAYTMVDDDDGNLANGTPNAAYINQAYVHHDIAEPTLITDSANCVPPTDPVITTTPLFNPTNGAAQVRITWPDTNPAAFYVVYRNTRLGDVWLPVRNQVLDNNSPTYTVYDEPAQIGSTYNYAVVAVTTMGCPSPGANVQTQTVALPDPAAILGTVTDPAPGGNNNGIPEPGEVLRVQVNLREQANLVGLTAADITLSSSDPLAIVTVAGPIVYGDVAAGATVNGPSTFEVRTSVSHGCGSFIPLTAAISSTNACVLRSLAIPIPMTGCTPANIGEAAPTAITLGTDDADPTCTDADGTIDNGELVNLTVAVSNAGGAPATNVNVNLIPQSPLVVVGTNPVIIPSLAGGASTNAMFQVRSTGGTCAQSTSVTATVNSTENLFPLSRSASYTLEQDRGPASVNTNFETDLGGWTSVGFVRQNRRASAANGFAAFAGPNDPPLAGHACDGSADGAGDCKSLTSPIIRPAAGSTMILSNWYSFEPRSGGAYYDRANVHAVNVVTGVHTLLQPTAGKMYNGSANNGAGLCHIDNQNAWAGNSGATMTWGTSTFNLAPFAGQDIQVEINYNSDGSAICEGLYIDDITITAATQSGCDTLNCSAPSCPQPLLVVQGVRAVKDGADVDLSWTQENSAAGGYHGYRAELDKRLIATSRNIPPTGVTLVFSTAGSATATTATDVNGISSTSPHSTLGYYQVLSVCANGGAEGPN